MRRWYVPLAVLGLGGIGALLLNERRKSKLLWLKEGLQNAPDRWLEWNDSLQIELDRIQASLDRIAESLERRPEMGH